MSSRFQSVHHVQPNSPVSAENTAQSTRELEARTNQLQEQLDGVAAGMVLQLSNRAISAAVVEGAAVYWDATNSVFAPALAGATHDAATGTYVATDGSDVLGVCLHKEDANTGTIVFAGFAELTPDKVLNLFGAGATPGRYYLSATTAGRLTRQRPGITIAVAYLLGPATACDTNSWVYILPQHRNFLEDHVHYQLELTALPAGSHTPPDVGESHVITDADAELPGWLPAADASFNGTAPAGAIFGYNVAADTALSLVWPPLPTSSAAIEILRPGAVDAEEISGFVRVPDNFVRIDLNGIWWMTDCYNQVPWNSTYNSDSEAVSSSSSAADTCPVTPPVRITLSFLRMLAITDKTVVTSLQAAVGEPLEFLDINGLAATTGDLYAKLNLALIVADDEEYGGQVLKGISTAGTQFTRGWVTEGLVSVAEAVILSSTRSRALDPDNPVSESNPSVHQGIVTIDFLADGGDRELQPQLTKLTDTLEREHKGVLYLGFPSGRTSSAKFSIVIPDRGLPSGDLQMSIRTRVFGRVNGVLPAITMSYYRVIRPTENTPTAISISQTAFAYDVVTPSDDVDGSGTDLSADNIIEVESAPFTVAMGDTVFITVQRAATAAPAFAGDFALVRLLGVVSRVE
jgi:hypothetical protein